MSPSYRVSCLSSTNILKVSRFRPSVAMAADVAGSAICCCIVSTLATSIQTTARLPAVV